MLHFMWVRTNSAVPYGKKPHGKQRAKSPS
jgi:hypothetical protein